MAYTWPRVTFPPVERFALVTPQPLLTGLPVQTLAAVPAVRQ